jgi:hypothetical protein
MKTHSSSAKARGNRNGTASPRPPSSVPTKDIALWCLKDVAAMTGLSHRMIQTQASSGHWPKPCVAIGRRRFWLPRTVLEHLNALADKGVVVK